MIIGDSNVGLIPPYVAEGVQIDSFPGARWGHAEILLDKADSDTSVEKLVLSFGLNNRRQRDKNAPITELRRALRQHKKNSPKLTFISQ